MSGKTVFISYRRSSLGKAFARNIQRELTHKGYDTFLDVDSIDAGKWAEQLRQEVPTRSHFLLLLTPGSLDKCKSADDWVRKEIKLAVEHGRNIVPVLEESAKLSELKKACPDDLKYLFGYQATKVRLGGDFEADINKLLKQFVAPHKAPTTKNPTQTRIEPTRLKHGADHLFGRDKELAALDKAWEDTATKVMTIVAWGGVGKTSLVGEWMARKAKADWPGFERVFDWSFYSQGTTEKGSPSSEVFIKKALIFFGDKEMAESTDSAQEKGTRLAQLVAERPSLLVLDGLEPLQHPPGQLAGRLKDPAVEVLLKGLAQNNRGLCLVTTRVRVEDLARFRGTTAPEWNLERLPLTAGVDLLKKLNVRGTEKEYQRLVKDVDGHALTLSLIGTYLAKAHDGDIRKRDRIKLRKADSEIQGGHAFRAMDAYEKWLSKGGKKGERCLAVLRLLGLFDRPANAGCMGALRKEPPIAGLTEPLIGLDEEDWNLTLSELSDCRLIGRQSDSLPLTDGPPAIDSHPLIREYFANQLQKDNPEAWRAAHKRLYEHLTETTTDKKPKPTLEDLQPLYQAVAHGCQAGMYQDACNKVYWGRISRGQKCYSWKKVGAIGANLSAVACFFEKQWSQVSSSLTEPSQTWFLNEAAIYLRALGRLAESLEPTRAGLEMAIDQKDWKNAAIIANNLDELELTLGKVSDAITDGARSVGFADQSEDAFERLSDRTAYADALHQAGRREEALKLFQEAEAMQAEWQPKYPLLYSLSGFLYCDLLLVCPERAAWAIHLGQAGALTSSADLAAVDDVQQRAAQTLVWATGRLGLLDIALDHLSIGRVALYRAVAGSGGEATPEATALDVARQHMDAAVDGLRRAGRQDHIPRGILFRAWLRFVGGDPDRARADLDEAWEIAERGPMPLFMADILLYRARLFRDRDALEDAAKLIEETGYGRRKEELEDARKAAVGW